MNRYVDREKLAALFASEMDTFRAARPRSAEEFARATKHMPDGVPMLWMAKWPGPWPVYVREASGAHFTCVDGIDHVDLCLGDTGAMCGHAPAACSEIWMSNGRLVEIPGAGHMSNLEAPTAFNSAMRTFVERG